MAKTPDPSRSRPATLDVLRKQAASCRRCDLWARGTQTVFGSGAPHARVVLVGEQPGDVEDQKGEPFVGPAGRLLREALGEAGLDLADVYLTNAVKHFKWVPRGKRRIHQKPNRDEIVACRPWLDGELAAIKPSIVVALGATAAGALLGPQVRVTRDRGQFQATSFAPFVTVTVHPSSILRSRTDEERRDARDRFVQDLRAVAERLRKIPHRSTSRRG
ncbi:MAG TPA: UdgX family uracil-DNA binding protein [Vicinamibacterales bacterium]|nr:UdgX family uracil-DNA binding protein [Vicinamibacterales bacterium]